MRNCPTCGGATLVQETRDVPYAYKGDTRMIPGVTGEYCHACGESILDAAETDRVMQAMQAHVRAVNEALVSPGFILGVRQKLGLDQREAAQLFGGGVNAFSRYETGKTQPPLALVQLFRLLDRHPELMAEMQVPR